MSEEENTNLGPLMKAARKFKKFNQSEVASAIGCSQSALSKMEHNLLIPNAPQWFLFSRFTTIPPESIETGIIDRHSKVLLNNEAVSLGYKIPKRYCLNRAQKVREIYPFLFYFEKHMQSKDFAHFFETTGIEGDFFLDFDNLVNFQMNIDLINLMIKLGKDSVESIKQLVEVGQNDIYLDHPNLTCKKAKNVKDVLVNFAADQVYFQGDFLIRTETKGTKLEIGYIPEPHLYHYLKDVGQEVTDFLTTYRRLTLENLAYVCLEQKIDAKVSEVKLNSPLESHFIIEV